MECQTDVPPPPGASQNHYYYNGPSGKSSAAPPKANNYYNGPSGKSSAAPPKASLSPKAPSETQSSPALPKAMETPPPKKAAAAESQTQGQSSSQSPPQKAPPPPVPESEAEISAEVYESMAGPCLNPEARATNPWRYQGGPPRPPKRRGPDLYPPGVWTPGKPWFLQPPEPKYPPLAGMSEIDSFQEEGKQPAKAAQQTSRARPKAAVKALPATKTVPAQPWERDMWYGQEDPWNAAPEQPAKAQAAKSKPEGAKAQHAKVQPAIAKSEGAQPAGPQPAAQPAKAQAAKAQPEQAQPAQGQPAETPAQAGDDQPAFVARAAAATKKAKAATKRPGRRISFQQQTESQHSALPEQSQSASATSAASEAQPSAEPEQSQSASAAAQTEPSAAQTAGSEEPEGKKSLKATRSNYPPKPFAANKARKPPMPEPPELEPIPDEPWPPAWAPPTGPRRPPPKPKQMKPKKQKWQEYSPDDVTLIALHAARSIHVLHKSD